MIPTWHLYVLECSDGSFYTGITTNLDSRVKKHNAGKASKYTRSRLPVRLMSQVIVGVNRGQALSLESSFKKLKRKDKEKYVELGLTCFLDDLSSNVNS